MAEETKIVEFLVVAEDSTQEFNKGEYIAEAK